MAQKANRRSCREMPVDDYPSRNNILMADMFKSTGYATGAIWKNGTWD